MVLYDEVLLHSRPLYHVKVASKENDAPRQIMAIGVEALPIDLMG